MKALDLAHYIITKCTRDGIPISNLQLQKFLYFIQKEFLQKTWGVAFNDRIEAWQFGPVVPTVYYEYCNFGVMPISIVYDTTKIENDIPNKSLVDKVISDNVQKNPWELVRITHATNSAWDKVYQDNKFNNTIPVELIKSNG